MNYESDDDVMPTYVMLPRRALLEFFGEMALPPWTDSGGSWIGGDIDCAPIAQHILEWIESHDLAGGAGPLGTTRLHEEAKSAEPAEADWVDQAEPTFHFE